MAVPQCEKKFLLLLTFFSFFKIEFSRKEIKTFSSSFGENFFMSACNGRTRKKEVRIRKEPRSWIDEVSRLCDGSTKHSHSLFFITQ